MKSYEDSPEGENRKVRTTKTNLCNEDHTKQQQRFSSLQQGMLQMTQAELPVSLTTMRSSVLQSNAVSEYMVFLEENTVM